MTAVEWLEKRLLGIVFLDTEYSTIEYEKRIDKAKGMEKQQQDDFAIEFVEWILNSNLILNRITVKELLEQFKNK
jgi:hypothetical protein